MSHVICNNCAAELPAGFSFCGHCGQKIDAVAAEPLRPDLPSIPLVGRQDELRELLARWSAACSATPWIEIRGGVGIGKTRLVHEAAKRIEDRPLLTITAGAHTMHRPFEMVRQLVHAVLREVMGHTSLPDTRDAFAASVLSLGHTLAPFVEALWCVAAPDRVPSPSLHAKPQMLRWMLQGGLATLLTLLAKQAPALTLFIDAWEDVDVASAVLFTSLHDRLQGLPLAGIVASRDDAPALLPSDTVLRLEPLSHVAAADMLERLLPGANLPEELRRDVLTHAAGIPLYLETIARLLINEGIATSAEAGADWAERVRTVLSAPLRLYGQTVIDQLSEPQCDLLGQCAVQGQSFDPDVMEVLWRLSDQPGPPVRVRLSELERQGLVQRTGHDWWTQWSFTHPLVHKACYQALAPLDRQRLHRRTAEALNEIADRLGRPLPELLAYHYECAEHWTLAARANLHVGNRAGDIFLNDEALRRYQRVIEIIGQLETPSEDLMLVKVRALQGAAKVGLRIGAYNQVAVHAEAMRALATQPEDRAQADRLTALVSFNRGQTDAAERLLLNSLERARHADHTQHVMAEILCDLVELYRVAGCYQVARERLHECCSLAFSSEDHTLIRTKLLEADLADAEGQRAAVSALYAQAHALAQQAGSLTELARASNGLGCAALDLGDYAAAQHHFERALEICELTGDTEWIGCAHGNLGLVAMSQGNFDIAQDHYERTLAVYQMTGPAYRSATVQANLAICALEEEDFLGAVTAAETALAMLRRSGHTGLQAQIQAWLGAGRLECGDVQGAEEVFKTILHDYDEEHQPVAMALACRGLGRVALMRGRPDMALDWLERAQAGFKRLAWAQETARTALYQALALRHRGEVQAARIALERAREQFISKRMQANRDAERAEQLLRELDAALSI